MHGTQTATQAGPAKTSSADAVYGGAGLVQHPAGGPVTRSSVVASPVPVAAGVKGKK